MYSVFVQIEGISPLLQHRFPLPDLANLSKGGKKQTGATDFTQEWRNYFYATREGDIYQPAAHIEGALITAAVNYKIVGKRGKSYKDLFRAAVFVSPDEIRHGVKVPETLTTDADAPLYVDMRPVVVNRARVVRLRPAFSPGWKLSFEIQVIDDQIDPVLVQDILVLAGKTVGIGDYRPRFGRFNVTHFQLLK